MYLDPEDMVPNPNAGFVRVGSYVTQCITRRRIFVAKRNACGFVWEPVEPNQSGLMNSVERLADENLRHIGTAYEEYEPPYISREKFNQLTDPTRLSLGGRVRLLFRQGADGNTMRGGDVVLLWEKQPDSGEPLAVFSGPNAEANARAVFAAMNR